MRRPRLLALAAVAAVFAAAGCGGGSSSDDGGTGGGPHKGGILTVGTTDYIDSLNPFHYITLQSYNALIVLYPQLVQYALVQGRPEQAGDRRRLGGLVGALGGRQGLDVPPEAEHQVV